LPEAVLKHRGKSLHAETLERERERKRREKEKKMIRD
jgi:hypothetical protein